jgi:rhomboid protease GluP
MDWKRFFDRLGMNGTRWQWRMMHLERNWRSLLRGNLPEGGWSLTKIIIGLNLLFFSLMIIQGVLAGMGLRPLLNPGGYLLIHAGGQYWPLVLDAGEWWRCITYAYTHGGLIHLGFNMMVLYQVGPMIEQEIGTVRFIVLYTLTALTATLAGLLWHPISPVVGASGSLFGLIGFAITYYHRIGGSAAHNYRNFMLKWAAIAFVFGLLVGADNAGHLGGAVGGALFGLILPIGIRGRQALKPVFNLLGGVSVLATVASLLLLVSSWFRG